MRTPDIENEQQMRAAIMAAARKMFRKLGFEKTSMEDIAREIGRGKGTVYYYYKSKEEIFRLVAGAEFSELINTINEAMNGVDTVSEKVAVFFITMSKVLREKVVLYSVMLKEHKAYMDPFSAFWKETYAAEIKMIKDLLAEGVKNGEFKSVSEKDCSALAEGLNMLWGGMEAEVIMFGMQPLEESKIEKIIGAFIRGLR